MMEAVLSALVAGPPGGDPVALQPRAVDALRAALAALPEASLVSSVAQLCTLAGWLAVKKQSPNARALLLDVAVSAVPRVRDEALRAALGSMAAAAHVR